MELTMDRQRELEALCLRFRREVLTAIHKAQSGHPGGSLSVCEILTLLYQHRMNIPGTSDGNWGFTFQFGWWWDGFTDGLKYTSELFGRNQKPAPEKEEIEEKAEETVAEEQA